jgi:hypothetical protein
VADAGQLESEVSSWPSEPAADLHAAAGGQRADAEQLAGDELLAGGGMVQQVAEPEPGADGVRRSDDLAVDGALSSDSPRSASITLSG